MYLKGKWVKNLHHFSSSSSVWGLHAVLTFLSGVATRGLMPGIRIPNVMQWLLDAAADSVQYTLEKVQINWLLTSYKPREGIIHKKRRQFLDIFYPSHLGLCRPCYTQNKVYAVLWTFDKTFPPATMFTWFMNDTKAYHISFICSTTF